MSSPSNKELLVNMSSPDQYPLLRKPHPSELEYFENNPHVAGMATEDSRIIFNPYSSVHPKGSQSVYKNEAARLFLKKQKNKPKIQLTDEQKMLFKDYSSDEQDIIDTIIARLIAGDESAGSATSEQKKYAESLSNQMMDMGY